MKRKTICLYHIDNEYLRKLASIDNRVISPDINETSGRPFVGIVVPCFEIPYFVPLASPKEKHLNMNNDKDFLKIFDKHDKLIGVLNFNNMVPVDETVVNKIDFTTYDTENTDDLPYKELLKNQLEWCNQHNEQLTRKATKLRAIVIQKPAYAKRLTDRCCDFSKLESALKTM